MFQNTFQIGDRVTAIYKTGKYIGEITGMSDRFYLVRVLAVVKHPMQGDLHNPKQVDVALFHARKALSYREQTNVPMNMVKPFEEEIPDYTQSLKKSLEIMKESLSAENTPWNRKSLETINMLENEYFK